MRCRLALALLMLAACAPQAPPPDRAATAYAPSVAGGLALEPHELPPLSRASAMSNEGSRLALATRTGEVCVVDLDRREVTLRVPVGGRDAWSVAWSSDDALLSSFDSDGRVLVRTSRSGDVVARFRTESRPASARPSPPGLAFVAGDARILVSADGLPSELWDWRAPRLVARLEADSESRPRSFAIGRTGRSIATSDSAGVVRVWDATTGEARFGPWIVPVATRQPGHVALDFAPGDELLAIGCGDAVVRIAALDGSSAVRELGSPLPLGFPDAIGSVQFSPDGTRLVAALFPVWDKRLFDVASGRQISEVDRGGGNDSAVGAWFSRDGERVVFGDAREVRDGRDLSRLFSQDRHYYASWYQSDGEHAWAVTGGMLRVFRTIDGATVLELPIRTSFGSPRPR